MEEEEEEVSSGCTFAKNTFPFPKIIRKRAGNKKGGDILTQIWSTFIGVM